LKVSILFNETSITTIAVIIYFESGESDSKAMSVKKLVGLREATMFQLFNTAENNWISKY